MQLSKSEIDGLKALAIRAGQKTLEFYQKEDLESRKKSDGSPVSEADFAANEIIVDELSKSNYPLISEESPFDETRLGWKTFWLVDPLDGTKDFLQKTGHFTVNIGLVHNQKPVWGVVYSPVKDLVFHGGPDYGAFCGDSKISVRGDTSKKTALESFFHSSKANQDFYSKNGINEIIKMGSSLKFCEIARGKADVYARFGPTCEWDTAAGHAILNAAGGTVIDLSTGKELLYNKEDIKNPHFIASQRTDWVYG